MGCGASSETTAAGNKATAKDSKKAPTASSQGEFHSTVAPTSSTAPAADPEPQRNTKPNSNDNTTPPPAAAPQPQNTAPAAAPAAGAASSPPLKSQSPTSSRGDGLSPTARQRAAEEKSATLAAFSFGESADAPPTEGEKNGDAFVAFGDAGGAFDEPARHDHDHDDNAEGALAKPRRVAVSDECADEEDASWTPPVVPKTDADRELISRVLVHNTLLKSLEGKDLETVIDAMSPLKFPAGTRVLEQGGEGGRHYYVIEAGTVEIIKNNQLVCTFSEGQAFGEMELMYVQPCVATVRTRVPTTTWALDRRTYKRCVMKLAVERRKLYTELLANVDFLANMTEYEKQTLADALSPTTLQAGEYLLRRGERNEWMYIIIEGVVEVWATDRNDAGDESRTVVCELARGNCVGELEFLNQHPTLADCIAKTTVRACKLHRDHFELCLGPVVDVLRRTVRQDKYSYYASHLEDAFEDPQQQQQQQHDSKSPASGRGGGRRHRHAVSAEVDTDDQAGDEKWAPPVIEKSAESVAQAEAAVRRCPLFSALSEDDAALVVRALEPVHFANDAVIVQEGHVPAEAFWYIIAAGSVVITRIDYDEATGAQNPKQKELALLTEGQTFGELDLMYSTASTVSATAMCLEGVDLFRLDRVTYRKLIMKATVERRALYRELLTGIPFLADLTEPQQLVLADALQPVHFKPGEILCRIHHVNEWMYIIVDGVVEVYGAAGLKVCDLRRGEMVGELEFFNKHVCVANCSAKTHVKACRLHRQHFEACMGPAAGFIDAMLKTPKYSYYASVAKTKAQH